MAGGVPTWTDVSEWLSKRNYARVLAEADQALAGGHLSRGERAEWLRFKATALSSANPFWVGRAVSCVHEALQLVRGNPGAQARLLATLAPIHAEARDHRLVRKVLDRFLLLNRRHPGPDVAAWEGLIRFNLALCYAARPDKLQQAARTYRQALSAWESGASALPESVVEGWRAAALHNLSGVLLQLGHMEQAQVAARQSAAMLPGETWGAKVLNLQAELLLAEGNATDAIAVLSEALDHQSLANDGITRADILFNWARAELQLGRREAVRAKIMEALGLAMKRGHPRLIRQILTFLEQPGLEGMEVAL